MGFDELQSEHTVGDDAEFSFSRNSCRPTEGVAFTTRGFGERDFVFDEEAHIPTFSARDFQRNHDVGDHQCVFEEEAFDGAVAARPVEAREGDVCDGTKMGGSAASEAVRDAPGTGALVVVELAEGALQVAVVVELLKPTEHLLAAAADKLADLLRAVKTDADLRREEYPHRVRSVPSGQSFPRGESAGVGEMALLN